MAPVIYKGWPEKSARRGGGGPRGKAGRHGSAQLVQLAEELGGSHEAGHPLPAHLVACGIEEDQGRQPQHVQAVEQIHVGIVVGGDVRLQQHHVSKARRTAGSLKVLCSNSLQATHQSA